MRPMTETRKRRLSDPQLLANKRLSNGFSKTDHVTTRSQAKNDPSSRVSPARKVKHKHLTTEERRLMISMSLRHEEKHTAQAFMNSHSSSHQDESTRKALKRNCRLLSTSGRTNGRAKVRIIGGHGLRTKILSSINGHQNEIVVNEAQKRAREVKTRETRAKKRRSALWVLNCEAEEFLFGETAAEDHEVELPPILSPPRKRRRMRATELGELLKETPLLESKLRSVPGSSESEEDSMPSSEVSTKRKEKKNRGSREIVKLKVQEINFSEEETLNNENNTFSNLDFSALNYNLVLEPSSPSPTLLDPMQSQSVRIQRILESLQWTFSFESVPSSEVWYETFCHQERPREPFLCPIESPVRLPYEAKGVGRGSLKRIRRPPRKSPRCHASTQAILSALKPRSGRHTLPITPTSSCPPSLPSPPKKSITVSHIQETPVSSTSSSISSGFSLPHPRLRQNSDGNEKPTALNESTDSVNQSASNAIENGMKACEMTATQYLWDSIQFLSDPYVINVLSLSERTVKKIRQPNSNQISSSPSNLDLFEKQIISSKRNNLKNPLKLLIPSPKSSPRMYHPVYPQQNNFNHPVAHVQQNGNCSKAEQMDLLRRKSPATSPLCNGKSRILRSPPTSPLSSIYTESKSLVTTSPTSTNVRKSPRKSPVVLVSDLSTVATGKQSGKFKSGGSPASKLSPYPLCPIQEEEVLFSVSMDQLPDFPWELFA